MTPRRTIPFAEILNFRDLGGYPTTDGRATRWGRLYRSSVLHTTSEADLELFRHLGIVTVVDLRSAAESERTGRGLLASEAVRFVNAPMLSGADLEERRDTSVLDIDYLSRRYLQYLDEGGSAFVRATEEMADVDNYPLVFNCFFGKDRTGVLAALILSCLGVERQEIIDDYALTATRVPLILEKLGRDSVYRETIDRTNPILLAANSTTMTQFLYELDQRYGDARAWAVSAGVRPQQFNILADILLE